MKRPITDNERAFAKADAEAKIACAIKAGQIIDGAYVVHDEVEEDCDGNITLYDLLLKLVKPV